LGPVRDFDHDVKCDRDCDHEDDSKCDFDREYEYDRNLDHDPNRDPITSIDKFILNSPLEIY